LKTIGLFFGSFNPIHVGHLVIAETVATSDLVDELWFIVSPQNPFKKKSTLAHEFDRYDMVEAAIKGNERLKVSDIEFRMPKPSYTVDTLAFLTGKHPNDRFRVLIGGDNLVHFHKWKNFETILNEYGLIVYPRPGSSTNKFSDHPNVNFIDAFMMDISASAIRQRIAKEQSVQYMLPEQVIEVIELKKLYRN